MSILSISGRRFLQRHPWQTGLAVTGIALGVAVVVGVDVANDSVSRSFDASTEIVAGKTTHQVLAAGGSLPDDLYVSLRTQLGVLRAAPVVEGSVRLLAWPDRAIPLLGLDPYSEAPFRGYVGVGAGGDVDLSRLLTEPGAVVIPRRLADRLAIGPGDTLRGIAADGPRTLTVAGIADLAAGGGARVDELVVADIATAQELTRQPGRLTRIDLILGPGEEARVRDALPASVELVTSGQRNSAILGMTAAFRLNLTALSLLALLVGAFLIYSTLSFMVVRRRHVHGMLRAVGVTGPQLFFTTVCEALMVGIPGTLLGLALGAGLGTGLVSLVTRTVDDLYFSVVAAPAGIAVASLAKGAVLGIGGTLAAAIVPAREAARASPRSLLSRASMERRTLAGVPRLAAVSLGTVVLAVVVLAVSRSLVVSFVGLFLFVAGAAAMTPVATVIATGLAQRLAGPFVGLPGRLALRGVEASLSRTGIAVAALTVAVAAVIGIGTMIGSFRLSVSDWLTRTVSADLYVSGPAGAPAPLDDRLVAAVEALDGVAATRVIRRTRLPTSAGDLRLWAIRMEPPGRGLALIDADPDSVWPKFDSTDTVIVSEALARKRQLDAGDTLTLRTADGPVGFRVIALFRDYSTDQGVAAMHLDVYRRHWPDRGLSGIGIFLQDTADAAAVRTRIDSAVGSAAVVTASRDIRQASLAIFDRTFTVTEVLRLLAGLVAFLGVFSALQALQLERAREVAVLRAVGLGPGQVGLLTLLQTGLLGLCAGLFAVPVGVALAWLLIRVINERAFGWTMVFQVTASAMIAGVALAVAAAVLAGVYPALRSARLLPAAHLRDE